MKKRNLVKNVIVGFGGQFIVILLGFILPRLFISNYGSDINGLLSTITQIFTYMALLEAGVGQASRNALFKPIANDDKNGINVVISSSYHYFRKFTVYYAICVIVFGIIAPYILNTNVDKITVSLIILFQGLSGVFNFYFTETPSILLSAYGKNYINSGITLANRILSYFAQIVLAILGVNIVMVQVANFIITIAKVFVYRIYINKKYSWISYNSKIKNVELKDRNSYVITEAAWTVFSSTDMVIISIFLNTQLASVYSVYNMVFNQISVLLNAVYASVLYVLGYSFHKNLKQYAVIHDSFTSAFLGTMTIIMSVCYVLIIPFVTLYTKGVNDVNYIYKSLPLMFCSIQILSWSRYVTGNLTGLAGYAKQTSYISLIEALTNLILSILFVNKFGIIGVTFATVIALPLKVIWCLYVSDVKVLKRSFGKSIRPVL